VSDPPDAGSPLAPSVGTGALGGAPRSGPGGSTSCTGAGLGGGAGGSALRCCRWVHLDGGTGMKPSASATRLPLQTPRPPASAGAPPPPPPPPRRGRWPYAPIGPGWCRRNVGQPGASPDGIVRGRGGGCWAVAPGLGARHWKQVFLFPKLGAKPQLGTAHCQSSARGALRTFAGPVALGACPLPRPGPPGRPWICCNTDAVMEAASC
jgi:hypothetical protein